MGEKPNPSFTHQDQLFYHELSYVRVLLMTQVQILVVTLIEVIWGHMTSSEIPNRFWLITHDWKELQAWAWCHCACIDTTNRLMCNMSYLDQYLTSDDLDLGSHKGLTLLRSSCTWFDAPWREKHIGTRIMPLAFLVQKLLAKNVFGKKKTLFWDFWSLKRKPLMVPQIWWYVSERTAQELSNVFSPGLVTKIVSGIMTHFWEEIRNFGKFDLWWPLVILILTRPQNDLSKYCRA